MCVKALKSAFPRDHQMITNGINLIVFRLHSNTFFIPKGVFVKKFLSVMIGPQCSAANLINLF
jgi:hypothetical protein